MGIKIACYGKMLKKMEEKMKQLILGILAVLSIGYYPTIVSATLVDLTSFLVSETVSGSVVENGGTITFTENALDAALYFYNDLFFVPMNSSQLTFDYVVTLTIDDTDYLQFNINHAEQFSAGHSGSKSGNFIFNMAPY